MNSYLIVFLQYFWPFDTDSKIEDYDLPEFIVYIGIPVLIFFIYRFVLKKYYKEKLKPSKTVVLFFIIWCMINIFLELMYEWQTGSHRAIYR